MTRNKIVAGLYSKKNFLKKCIPKRSIFKSLRKCVTKMWARITPCMRQKRKYELSGYNKKEETVTLFPYPVLISMRELSFDQADNEVSQEIKKGDPEFIAIDHADSELSSILLSRETMKKDSELQILEEFERVYESVSFIDLDLDEEIEEIYQAYYKNEELVDDDENGLSQSYDLQEMFKDTNLI